MTPKTIPMAATTDRERIDAILSGVVDNLITDRCCTSCSSAAAPDGTYAFYHSQDIERSFALPGDNEPVGAHYGWAEDEGSLVEQYSEATSLVSDLYIGFGINDDLGDAPPPLEREYAAVGRRIVQALKAGGFGYEWTGSSNQKVRITSVSTTRRLS